MRKRTRAREFALQLLYQLDITRETAEKSLDAFWQHQDQDGLDDELKNFSAHLVKGVAENLSAIDEKVALYATNWELERMAVVDRNILRMGAFELMFCDDIPPKVSINEAVDLAKKYSGIEAGKFVNAILDKIKLEKEK